MTFLTIDLLIFITLLKDYVKKTHWEDFPEKNHKKTQLCDSFLKLFV